MRHKTGFHPNRLHNVFARIFIYIANMKQKYTRHPIRYGLDSLEIIGLIYILHMFASMAIILKVEWVCAIPHSRRDEKDAMPCQCHVVRVCASNARECLCRCPVQ